MAVAVKDVLFEPVRKTQDASHFKQARYLLHPPPCCRKGRGGRGGSTPPFPPPLCCPPPFPSFLYLDSLLRPSPSFSISPPPPPSCPPRQVVGPDGQSGWFEPCSPGDPQGFETTLEEIDTRGYGSKVCAFVYCVFVFHVLRETMLIFPPAHHRCCPRASRVGRF